MMCAEPVGHILMQVKYRITAQLEPTNHENWIASIPTLRMSKVRHERDLFVNKDPQAVVDVPSSEKRQSLTSKVGGFLGLGKTECHSEVILPKETYTVGETIRVTIKVDNSECKKDISGFKLKLLRNIQATSLMSEGEKTNANHQKYISVFKDSEGVASQETKDIEIELEIPLIDDYHPETYNELPTHLKENVTEETFPIMKAFSSSFFGQIVKVWFTLKVFVKHDAWNEWGEGQSVDFPIKIMPQPS